MISGISFPRHVGIVEEKLLLPSSSCSNPSPRPQIVSGILAENALVSKSSTTSDVNFSPKHGGIVDENRFSPSTKYLIFLPGVHKELPNEPVSELL